MAEFELLRGKPAILQLTRGRFIRLRFRLQEEPNELVTRLNARQSIGNKIETRPERSYSVWRLIQDQLTQQEADELRRLEQMSLERGEAVEIIRDDELLFCLAGDVGEDQRRRARPTQAAGAPLPYGLLPWTGIYGLGSIGVYSGDSYAGTGGQPTSRTNDVLNGDAVDGVYGACPTDWTNPDAANVLAEKNAFLIGAGKGSYNFKLYSTSSPNDGIALRQTLQALPGAIPSQGIYTISFLARGDRPPTAALADVLEVWLGPEDAADPMVKIGSCQPSEDWEFFFFQKALSAYATTTDTNLRLEFRTTGDLAQAPVYLQNIQGENKKWFSSFVPNSSVRLLDGTRADDQILRFVNYLSYASQIPAYSRGDRWGFTVDFFFAPSWPSGSFSVSPFMLYQDSDPKYAGFPGLKISSTNTTITATAALADGSTVSVTASVTWAQGTYKHILVSYRDSSNPGTAVDGALFIAINGTSVDSDTHDQQAARQGEFILIGSDPVTSANRKTACGAFHHVRQTGFYIDGTTEGRKLTDFYSATIPPSRLRIATRAVLSPQQRGSIVKFEKNNYRLDATFIETS
jgi:hypothetical protein